MHAYTQSFLSAVLFSNTLIDTKEFHALYQDYVVSSFSPEAIEYASATLIEFDNLVFAEFGTKFEDICKANDWSTDEAYYDLQSSINHINLGLSDPEYGGLGQKLNTIAQQIFSFNVELDHNSQLSIVTD